MKKQKEIMVYKTLLLRIFFSLIIFFFFFTFYFIYPKYLFVFVSFIYLLIIYEVFKYFKYNNFLVYIYLLLSLTVIIYYLLYLYDEYLFLLFIFTIFLFDTFSYFFGKLFGSIKILPLISPNKTLEGLIGGFISTFVIILCYDTLFKKIFTSNLILFIFLIIILAFLGDLFQSYIKRKSKLKDSSNLLPGHGGFFDRMDSYILSVFILPFHGLIL